MFTGIVEELGEVAEVRRNGGDIKLCVRAEKVLDGMKIGDSISVDGVCLTVCELLEKIFLVDVIKETLIRTTLSNLRRGDRVNLERSVQANGRFGGHFVTGHVDGTGKIVKRLSNLITIQAQREIMRYVVSRGSVAVDGISLTVGNRSGAGFEVAIIPHTANVTSLGFKKEGSYVNLEADVLGKQVENLLRRDGGGITEDFLSEKGFII